MYEYVKTETRDSEVVLAVLLHALLAQRKIWKLEKCGVNAVKATKGVRVFCVFPCLYTVTKEKYMLFSGQINNLLRQFCMELIEMYFSLSSFLRG